MGKTGDWTLRYDGFDPAAEGLREVLCALGNGTIVSRAAATDARADDVHYPGTYLAGGYDRLVSQVGDRDIENEDLVNLPNWLPLAIRIDDGPFLAAGDYERLDHVQALALDEGVLTRSFRMRDAAGRITRWEERRLVSMHDPHVCALEVRLTPENWSGVLGIRAGIDGAVTNWGVTRYRALAGRHLEAPQTTCGEDGIVALRTRFVQSRREVALAQRLLVEPAGGHILSERKDALADGAFEEVAVEVVAGRTIRVEKIVAIFNSHDHAVAEPLHEACRRVAEVPCFEAATSAHSRAWRHLWEECDIRVESAENGGTHPEHGSAQLKLRLHVFHLLQTASPHSVDHDVGIPPRGWHGEAYRGHIMWDELFIFPFLTLRMPVLTRGLLRYRHRRLGEARRAAREAGRAGAMFPWMSGSNGREETQSVHLNPLSGRWLPDNSWRQRHIGAAVAYNVWQYLQATDDRDFLRDYGAELFLEIARFWSSLAEQREDGRFSIRRVMGPDEFHDGYPGRDPAAEGGLDDNAYTNFMVAWVLTRARDVLDLLPDDNRRRLCETLGIGEEEIARFDAISRNLVIPFHESPSGTSVISQFDGYGALEEFDWAGYRERYPNLQRLDRILESEGKDPNAYKVSKQADVLMIFYLFSRDEIREILDRLGYAFSSAQIVETTRYYMERVSHGSTLSFVTHAWVLARTDRKASWRLALEALDADIGDVQGGTTKEGIHLGAMAGTVDLLQRCYTGIGMRASTLVFDPRLPEEVACLETTVRFRRQILDVHVTQETLTVSSRSMTALPVSIAYRGHAREISPGQSFTFALVRDDRPDDRPRAALAARAARTDPPKPTSETRDPVGEEPR
ncbi:glycoside hydrolase family 65 protein [Salinarimonas ramus]|uniref:Trehalose 6-phosphate phosphorylase n=1 Tax=Salinarimonas ramus TaxID=690164 RepID=A0A917QDM6_9HYPH|nr:glycoside hydrolase family 65 protein [Salinarimonas ramus]GGK45662.1 trehalose 6-phosphate phosphorylase [Salinarimonas ramus]